MPSHAVAKLSLADAIHNQVKSPGTTCSAWEFISTLSGDDRDIVRKAFSDGTPVSAIRRGLETVYGVSLSHSGWMRHASRKCACADLV